MEQDSGRPNPPISLPNHTICTANNCVSTASLKCKTIAGIWSSPDLQIDDYNLYVADNVHAIQIIDRPDYSWDIEYSELCTQDSKQVYFYVEQNFSEAFMHWMYESALHLVLFKKLQVAYPNIQIICPVLKRFKRIVFTALNISNDCIVDKINNTNNRVIFPRAISMADHSNIPLFKAYINRFKRELTLTLTPKQKDIDVLFIPRGSRDNFAANDRTIPIQPELIRYLNYFKNTRICYADTEFDNFTDQIEYIRRASVILLTDGSSHGVNSYFAENSKIIVIGDLGHTNSKNPRPCSLLDESIQNGNKFYYISGGVTLDIMIRFIDDVLYDKIQPFHVPYTKNICWKSRCLPCDKL